MCVFTRQEGFDKECTRRSRYIYTPVKKAKDDVYYSVKKKAPLFASHAFLDSLRCANPDMTITFVPQKLNIKDKIFITNKSPCLIQYLVVAVIDEALKFVPVGSAKNISPNKNFEFVSYEDNKLKQLKGKVIAIKTKGIKKFTVGKDEDYTFTDDSSNVTYSFNAVLKEDRHDLYIEITGKDKYEGNIMDF